VVRNAVDRIVWVAKGAVFLVGFAAIFAVVFAAANALLGGGTPFSGESYRADPGTQQAASGGAGLAAEPVARRRPIEYPRGFAQVNVTGATVTLSSGSRGIDGVQRTENNVYCFDLTFTPRAAVASANINNNATVGTVLGGGVPSVCPDGFRDAAARTYAANDATSTPRSDINFGIVFI
jgi:hypothetical protein